MRLAVLIPVLNRPHRVEPLVRSIRDSTVEHCRIFFLCDKGDDEEIAAVREAIGRYDYLECRGLNYAKKINVGVRAADMPLVFTAADDLDFKPGWFEAAMAKLTGSVEVVGVNDLLSRPREHATHFLMTRRYAERPTIDGKPGPFNESYSHWFCDDELIATAKKRGVYAYAEDAHVEHLHPMAGKASDDDTYRQGRSRAYMDRKLFQKRSRLWT